jgi:hypothetical protein
MQDIETPGPVQKRRNIFEGKGKNPRNIEMENLESQSPAVN